MKNFSLYAGVLLAGVILLGVFNIGVYPASILVMTNFSGHEIGTEGKASDENVQKIEAHHNPESFTIMAFGDVMLGRFVRTLMDKNGKDYIFQKIDMNKPFFGDADVVFANLEGPIKGEGYKSQTSTVFGFNVDTAEFLKKYGFDVLSIANNHALDQGKDGRGTTISALESQGLGWCGNVMDVDSGSVYYGMASDASYAFVCLNDVNFYLDEGKALALIKDLKEKVDYVIVSIHWGYEYSHTPSQSAQVDFGHGLVDAGADFVIGHHPHVVQSFEKYNGKFIFYSLGNFVFDQYWSKDTQEELAIKITMNKDSDGNLETNVQLFPMKSEKSQPRLMTDDEKSKWIEKFISYGKYDDNMKNKIHEGMVDSED